MYTVILKFWLVLILQVYEMNVSKLLKSIDGAPVYVQLSIAHAMTDSEDGSSILFTLSKQVIGNITYQSLLPYLYEAQELGLIDVEKKSVDTYSVTLK